MATDAGILAWAHAVAAAGGGRPRAPPSSFADLRRADGALAVAAAAAIYPELMSRHLDVAVAERPAQDMAPAARFRALRRAWVEQGLPESELDVRRIQVR